MAYTGQKNVQPPNSKSSRNERFAQMTKQEELIEMKKKEIQQKLAEKKKKETEELMKKLSKTSAVTADAKKNLMNISKTKTTTIATPTTTSTSIKKFVEPDSSDSRLNQFSNDGSFMAQFKKISGVRTKKLRSEQSGDTSGLNNKTRSTNCLVNLHNTHLIGNCAKDNKPGVVMRLQTSKMAKCLPVLAPPSVFNEDEDKDKGIRSFLYDDKSAAYKYYRQTVSDMHEAKTTTTTTTTTTNEATAADLPEKKNEEEQMGPQEGACGVATAPVAETASAAVDEDEYEYDSPLQLKQTGVPIGEPGLIAYALKVYGSTSLTQDQWKQLDEQRKMKFCTK
uniref:Uncharacterized protein n=1 Tax=Strigamia maritima TaxID=126957 RepID=T1JFT5_STRMM